MVKNNTISNAHSASYNKLTHMTATCSIVTAPLYIATTYILDKNLEITHSVQEDRHSYYSQITWLDEFTVSLKSFDGIRIADLRMPRDFVHETKFVPLMLGEENRLLSFTGPFTSYHSLQTLRGSNLGYVWNMKDLTWSNVVVLPDDVQGTPCCNSRYAAFLTNNSSICLLDFEA